ncbi:MAG: DUF885 domain-containing protein [Vicinamibacterales bacterium]
MSHHIRLRALLAGTLLAVGVVALPRAQTRSIDDLFRTFTDEWVRSSPNQAIQTRYFTGVEQDALEVQITPLTREWRRRRVDMARRGLADLATFDSARLTDVQRVSADLMKWQLEVVVEGQQYEEFAFPLEQFAGANIDLVNALTVLHPLNTEKDAVNYVARLGQVATRMEEVTADARELAAKRMAPPRFIVRATVAQMQQFIGTPPAQNPYVIAFSDRMTASGAIPQARREELRAAAERVTATQIYPAWQRAIAVLEPLVVTTTDDAGLWRFKGGDAAYAYHLRRFTTTSLTADEIHQIGLREVTRIEKEMDAILRRLGRTEGSVSARVARLEQDLAYPPTEDGRTRIMTDIDGIISDAQKRSAALFDRVPRAPVIARPFPAFRENTAAANYGAPARDGSRPGTFQIPLRPSYLTKFGLRTLVYHETVPGHHFQIALELENDANPRFRQIRALGSISALTEGWGLYAERLVAESGWYEDDLEGQLGQLDGALFRARRLVVDTGIHAKRWTRQQAIDYGIEASEIDRYVVNPGQACAYMLGQLKIVELRDKAQKALGTRFSPKAFHNAVLVAGTVPLPILERQVDAYIRATAGSN